MSMCSPTLTMSNCLSMCSQPTFWYGARTSSVLPRASRGRCRGGPIFFLRRCRFWPLGGFGTPRGVAQTSPRDKFGGSVGSPREAPSQQRRSYFAAPGRRCADRSAAEAFNSQREVVGRQANAKLYWISCRRCARRGFSVAPLKPPHAPRSRRAVPVAFRRGAGALLPISAAPTAPRSAGNR